MSSAEAVATRNNQMNPEAKEALLQALRSGKYTQTTDYLHRYEPVDPVEEDLNTITSKDAPVGFCCLGVACDISGLGTWIRSNSGTEIFQDIEGDQAQCTLPVAVMQWLGTDEEGGFITDDGVRTSLAILNDQSRDYSRVIEAIEKYF